MTREFHHVTVMRDVTVRLLAPRPGSRALDGTLGGGGHSEALLDATAPDGLVVGIDRDPAALRAATARLSRFGDRFVPLQGNFAAMDALAARWAPFDAVVLDLGVSSPQLDSADRGFSLQADGPVDMRMVPSQDLDAAGLIARSTEAELARILREYGDEPRAGRIARALVAGVPWTSTLALANAVAKASGYRDSRIHPATRTFQALRIAVNDELSSLERGLGAAWNLLAEAGRLAVITFHSLEDRLVKHAFRRWAGVGTARDAFGHPVARATGRLVTRRAVEGRTEDAANPRARSARLRVVEKIAAEEEGPSGPRRLA